MSAKRILKKLTHTARVSLAILTAIPFSLGGTLANAAPPDQDHEKQHNKAQSPIQHVVVLIGENRTFDHVFATYIPRHGESVSNLLSKGIVNADGTPGPHFKKAQQFQAVAPFRTKYFTSLDEHEKAPYDVLPEPTLNFSPNGTTPPPFPSATPPSILALIEPSLETTDLNLLTTGASGASNTFTLPDPDTRVENFVITNYTNQIDSVFDNPPAFDDNGGGNSMAFYNVQNGDAPVLKSLADEFSMSDNFHQSFMGGTGANHFMLGTGDAIFWSDGQGNPTTPPSHIANPDPLPGTDDVYTVDLLFDGNFTECGNPDQPGIKPIRDYLKSLPYDPKPNCVPGHFYMVNNDSPGFLPDGTVDAKGIASGGSVPPTNIRTIGDALNDKGVSWAYYGGAYTAAVNLQHNPKSQNPAVQVGAAYCNICNFESYSTSIMGDPNQRATHIKDTIDFFAAVDNGTLPAVSFVKPDGLLDGHPASSKLDLFEAMLKKIVDHLNANQELFASTALIVTFDEGGGYYDSGYIQPLDFFGDGPRIPMIIVSPFTRGGHISHEYTDHVSILKFIERNWDLEPLTARSRDNFPNPKSDHANPYVPKNSPAIGDLFDLFDFDHDNGNHGEQ